jgi:pimeloyl-ACP methyl ester carboxylesterase
MRVFVKLIALIPMLALMSFSSSAVALDAPSSAKSAGQVVAFGTLHGASYRIDVPADWNHSLVVYFHGYSPTPLTFTAQETLSPMFDPMLERHYALIQSGYSAGGWAVEQAATDTEQLRKLFVEKYGAPKQTFVFGMSMGGALTAMTIETQPAIYAGALSLCGVVEPTNRMVQRDFALRAAFDYYFPGLLGELVPVPADFEPNAALEKKVAAALASKPAAMQALLRWYGAADARNIVGVIVFSAYEVKELQQRTHGNPFGNADLIYVGSGDDFALNDGVRRYHADQKAADYLARWYTPTGNLTRPLLELHDTGDPLVPANTGFEYALATQRMGHSQNFVQQYVNHEGHCVFTPDEIGRAFDEVVDWVKSGKPPKSGKLD